MEAAQEREAESWADSIAKGWVSSSCHWRPPNPWITEYERFATFVRSLPKATYWTKLPDPLVLLSAPLAAPTWFTTAQQTHRPQALTQPHLSPASTLACHTLLLWGFWWGPAHSAATKDPMDMHYSALPSQHTFTLTYSTPSHSGGGCLMLVPLAPL